MSGFNSVAQYADADLAGQTWTTQFRKQLHLRLPQQTAGLTTATLLAAQVLTSMLRHHLFRQ